MRKPITKINECRCETCRMKFPKARQKDLLAGKPFLKDMNEEELRSLLAAME